MALHLPYYCSTLFGMGKQLVGSHCLGIFHVLILTFHPCFKVKWGLHIIISPLFLVVGLLAVEIAHGKSLPANVLPVNTFAVVLKTLWLL